MITSIPLNRGRLKLLWSVILTSLVTVGNSTAGELVIYFPHLARTGERLQFFQNDVIPLVGNCSDPQELLAVNWYLDDEVLSGMDELNSADNYLIAENIGEHTITLEAQTTGEILQVSVGITVIAAPPDDPWLIAPCLGFPQFIVKEYVSSRLSLRLASHVSLVNIDQVELLPVCGAAAPVMIDKFFENDGENSAIDATAAPPGFYNLAVTLRDGTTLTQAHAVRIYDQLPVDFDFVQMSDPQIDEDWVRTKIWPFGIDWHINRSEPVRRTRFHEVIEEVNCLANVQFVFLSGDLTEFSTENNWQALREELLKLEIPTFVLPGNHDYQDTYIDSIGVVSLFCAWVDNRALRYYWDLINPAFPFGGVDTTRFGDLLLVFFDSGHSIDLWNPVEQYCFPDGSGPTAAQLHFLNGLDPLVPKIIVQHHPVVDRFCGQCDVVPLCSLYNNLRCVDGNGERCESTLNPHYDSDLGDSPVSLFYEYCLNSSVKLDLAGHTHRHRLFDRDRSELTYLVGSESKGPLFAQTIATFGRGSPAAVGNQGYRLIRVVGSSERPHLITEGHIVYLEPALISEDHETDTTHSALILLQNYPNPFNDETVIRYQLTHPATVRLKVVNVLGETVFSRDFGFTHSGDHNIRFYSGLSTHSLASGLYFYCLRAGKELAGGKMLLLK